MSKAWPASILLNFILLLSLLVTVFSTDYCQIAPPADDDNCDAFTCGTAPAQYTAYVCCDNGQKAGYDCGSQTCNCKNEALAAAIIAVIVIIPILVIIGICCCCFLCPGCYMYNRNRADNQPLVVVQATSCQA